MFKSLKNKTIEDADCCRPSAERRPSVRPVRVRSGARGYVLVLVVVVSIILGAGMFVLHVKMAQAIGTTRDTLRTHDAFYRADGAARGATVLAAEHLLGRAPPSPAQRADPVLMAAYLVGEQTALQAALEARKSLLDTPGFTIPVLTTSALQARADAIIPNGPFSGMKGHIQPYSITAVAKSLADDGGTASIMKVIEQADIPMFQFALFIEGYGYIYSGRGAKILGHVHVNGDACAGSTNGLYIEKLTASGNFYATGGSGCRQEYKRAEDDPSNIYIAKAPLSGGVADLSVASKFAKVSNGCSAMNWQGNSSPCTCSEQHDRDGPANNLSSVTAAAWIADARASFGDQLADKDLGGKRVKVPLLGDPLVQKGRNGAHLPEPNNDTSRFLLDPVFDGEPRTVSEQKFAYKADVRILNGVWYLRDEADPAMLGTPIWSDHPGHYGTSSAAGELWSGGSTQAVGQGDLFGSNARPLRYSYYVTAADAAASGLDRDAPTGATNPLPAAPVVSYGSLIRTAGTPHVWAPGYYPLAPCSSSCGGYGYTLTQAAKRGELLQATRSGFRSMWGETAVDLNDANQRTNLGLGTFDPKRTQLVNMLPVNFDVAAFAAALKDTGANELGARMAGRTFNGVVWIGSFWPGQNDGAGADAASSGQPKFWPFHGTQKDCASSGPDCQPFSTRAGAIPQLTSPTPDTAVAGSVPALPTSYATAALTNEPFEQALPFPLCTDRSSGSTVTFAASSTLTGATRDFIVPDCAWYLSSAVAAAERRWSFPNAVRVINAATYDAVAFPKGLTIATNLALFITGDVNKGSVASDVPGTFSVSYIPALLAGDSVHSLSNAWDDKNAPWNVEGPTYFSKRRASNTTMTTSILTGWHPSWDGNRDETTYVMRLHEDWVSTSAVKTVRGSFVIGFSSVFGFRFNWADAITNFDEAGKSVQLYDYNLDIAARQPPGSPLFVVTAVAAQSESR